MIVYVSGPMTGYTNFNRDAFFAAEAHLTAKGFQVVNPAALDDNTDGWSHADYLRRDIALLVDCDLIYMLPGWAHSKGASVENTVAKAVGILELHDPDVDLWRSFEGEPEIPCETEDPSATVGASDVLPCADDGDLFDHPRFGQVFEEIPEQRALLAEDVDGESHYLAGVERFTEGDEFPNVGYVRRMRALAEPAEPSPLFSHGGVVLHTTLTPEKVAEALATAVGGLRMIRGGRQ